MIRFFTSHPTVANLLMLLLLVMGIFSLPNLRRETFPDFAPTEVEIRVAYPGASAVEVEAAICKRIENAVDGINYVEEINSTARENVGAVIVTMADGADLQIFLDDIRTEIDGIRDFPDLAEQPVINALGRLKTVVSVAVSGEMPLQSLKDYCIDLKERMQRVDEISQVTITGFSDRQIRIDISLDVLQQYRLSINDIARVISAQSIDLPAGTIQTREQDILIRFADERRTVREFEDLTVISGATGAEIQLGAIATITDRFELDEQKVIFNGQQAGILVVTMNKTDDALDVFGAVKAFVEKERKTSPPGVRLVLTQDSSSIVKDRLKMIVKNGWQGLILVFLAMWLFFSFRLSFWVTLGLPVSFLGAFFFMVIFGYTIDMMTLTALLLGLGLLMDDAIVLSENIATNLQKGKNSLNATIDGIREVGAGVVYSFLTTLAIFIPLAFFEGSMGKILRVLPVILIFVLSVSLIEAFFILPNHLAHALRNYDPNKKNWIRRRIESAMEWVRENVVGRIADFAVSWRYLTMGLAIMVFMISIGMFLGGKLKFQPFPDLDGDVVQARIILPQGTALLRTEQVVSQLTGALEKVNAHFKPRQPSQQDLVLNISEQFAVNATAGDTGPHLATISVDLLSAEVRDATIDEIIAFWRKEAGSIPDIISIEYREPKLGPGGKPVVYKLQGNNLQQLNAASLKVMGWLGKLKGVNNIMSDLRPGKPEVKIRLREGATALGVTAQSIASQLRSSLYGYKAGEIIHGNESFEVNVRLSGDDRNSLEDLENIYILGPNKSMIPLKTVATFEEERGYSRIVRASGVRTVSVTADIDTKLANAREVTLAFKKQMLKEVEKEFAGVKVIVEGQAKENARTMTSMGKMFLIGIFGVFLLLSFQFKSYVEPFIVMLAIPFAFVGVIWGHLLMGMDLCMPSMLGFVSLSGVVVNDSILLVEFVKMRLRKGHSVMQAASQASRDRFRAVFLTSLTTAAGLLPLLAEKSLQAQIIIPIAISIVFGLLASTVMVLILVPTAYAVLEDFGLTAKVKKETADD